MEFENNAYFWQKLDTLYLSSDVVINYPKNSRHAVYRNLIYPVDYGYIEGNDGEKIWVYRGTKDGEQVDSIVVCVDILERDVNVKLLVGCNDEETDSILEFVNQMDSQKSVILYRGHNIPDWAVKE